MEFSETLRQKPNTPKLQPHLVLIAFYFPPSRASGVYRSLAVANYFAAQGWRVTVITVDTSFFDEVTDSRDDSLLDQIHPDVVVERVPFPAWNFRRNWSKLSWRRAFLYRLAYYPAVALSLVLQGTRFPDRYVTWINPVLERLYRIRRQQPIDVVVASGNPWSAFKAAAEFSARTGVPYALDYRDAWSLDLFSEKSAFSKQSQCGKAEQAVLSGASLVVYVNDPIRQWYAERYPVAADRMIVVENGFDLSTLKPVPFRRPPADRPLRFGFVGTVTAHHPHREMWQAWRSSRQMGGDLVDATVHIYGYMGFFSHQDGSHRDLLPKEENEIFYEGPVPRADVHTAYESVDILLLMIASSRYISAGKTYEHVATGKPLVCIFSPETAATDIITGYPLAFPIAELTPEAISEALQAAARKARVMTEEEYTACLQHARKYRREVQLEKLRTALEALLVPRATGDVSDESTRHSA